MQIFQSLANVRFQHWQTGFDCIPHHIETDAILGMPQTIPHAADIGPGLFRHQLRSLGSKSLGRFADSLKTALDSITHQAISLEPSSVHPGNIAFDSVGILNDVGQTIG
jgi:hypothetical protein